MFLFLFLFLEVVQPIPRPDDKAHCARIYSKAEKESQPIENYLPKSSMPNDFACFYEMSDPIRFYGFDFLLKIENVPQNKGKNLSSIICNAMMKEFESFTNEIALWTFKYYNKTCVFTPISSQFANEISKHYESKSHSRLKINSKYVKLVCVFNIVYFLFILFVCERSVVSHFNCFFLFFFYIFQLK